MRISTDYNFIFFSNPKTGSESVRKILEPYSDIKDNVINKQSQFRSHMPPKEVKVLFEERGWAYDDFFKFVFVRNPWAKMVSIYEMKYSGKPTKMLVAGTLEDRLKDRLKKFKQRYLVKKPSFKEWISTITPSLGSEGEASEDWYKYGLWPLDKYITDDQGNVLVDKVIKLENINHDLIPTLVELGIPNADNLVIERINTRKYNKYTTYYDAQTIAIVEKLFKYDIDTFNYTFGG